MQSLLPYLAIVVVILTGYGVYKKYHVNIVLLLAGLVLNLLAVAGGVGNILPKGTTSTGLEWFDIFELFRAVSRSQVASDCWWVCCVHGQNWSKRPVG